MPPVPPAFGDSDYQEALANEMPRGIIWRHDIGAIQYELLGALAPTYTRSTEAVAQMILDLSPATTVNLLTEWEESLGLPDPCTAPGASFSQRQKAVLAKWQSRGNMNIPFYVAVAKSLGYNATVTEYRPFRVGDPVGGPLYGSAWAFAWKMTASTDAVYAVSSTEFSCRIKAIAPAHTVVFFVFEGGLPTRFPGYLIPALS